jgi:hypothetical protein
MALVNRLNRGSFRLLGATPGVLNVYVRGSYARGSFIPLASDIDLVLILSNEEGRSLEHVIAIHLAMHKARRRNPSIRDWWHHMIIASELPVVETYSDLYGSREWRDGQGYASAPRSSWTDDRLRLAAAWSQLCLWSGSAFHAFLHPQTRIHNFEAGVTKTLRFWWRMKAAISPEIPADASMERSGRAAAGPVNNTASPDRITRLVEVYQSIERGAALILENAASAGTPGIPLPPGAPPSPAIIQTDRARFIVLEDGLSHGELHECFSDIARRNLPDTGVTYILPAAALRAWPFPAEAISSGPPPPPMPLSLAREIYLFEALFLPSALRLAVAFPDAKPRLRRVVASIRRAHNLYGGSNTIRTVPSHPGDTRVLFNLGSSLCEALQESLLTFAAGRKSGRTNRAHERKNVPGSRRNTGRRAAR